MYLRFLATMYLRFLATTYLRFLAIIYNLATIYSLATSELATIYKIPTIYICCVFRKMEPETPTAAMGSLGLETPTFEISEMFMTTPTKEAELALLESPTSTTEEPITVTFCSEEGVKSAVLTPDVQELLTIFEEKEKTENPPMPKLVVSWAKQPMVRLRRLTTDLKGRLKRNRGRSSLKGKSQKSKSRDRLRTLQKRARKKNKGAKAKFRRRQVILSEEEGKDTIITTGADSVRKQAPPLRKCGHHGSDSWIN